MKKVIEYADGTKEIIEGTAEEIAEYEKNNSSNKSAKKEEVKSGKRILLEDAIRKVIKEEFDLRQPYTFIQIKPIEVQPIPYIPTNPWITYTDTSIDIKS